MFASWNYNKKGIGRDRGHIIKHLHSWVVILLGTNALDLSLHFNYGMQLLNSYNYSTEIKREKGHNKNISLS